MIISDDAPDRYPPVVPPLEDLPFFRNEAGGKDSAGEMSGKTAWRCSRCGYIHYGDEPPDE